MDIEGVDRPRMLAGRRSGGLAGPFASEGFAAACDGEWPVLPPWPNGVFRLGVFRLAEIFHALLESRPTGARRSPRSQLPAGCEGRPAPSRPSGDPRAPPRGAERRLAAQGLAAALGPGIEPGD